MRTRRGEAKRIAAEIQQSVVGASGNSSPYGWKEYEWESLRQFAKANDIEVLEAIQRNLLPLQPPYTPGFIGLIVTNIRGQGIENAGELVTRESIVGWARMFNSINEYAQSIGLESLTNDEQAQKMLVLAFTDPEIADEVTALVCERGLMPAEAIRGLVIERRVSVTALHEGAL